MKDVLLLTELNRITDRLSIAAGRKRVLAYAHQMSWQGLLRIVLASVLSMPAGVFVAWADPPVDVALVLAIDVSRSMSPEELHLQRKGYATAIASREVIRAIELGAYGRIALTMFEWANDSHSREIVGWSVIETRWDAEEFADKVLASKSFGQRRTSISGAIRHSSRLLEDVPFKADRLVIDISGDGPNNQGYAATSARDRAVDAGIVINGLPLMTTSGSGSLFNIADLDEYYRRCVIGGPGSFVIPVNDWDQFPEAVRRKLILEIGGIKPEGAAEAVPVQFTFQDPYDCLIGEKIWRQLRDQYFLDP